MTSPDPIPFPDRGAARREGGSAEPRPLSSFTPDQQRILRALLDAARSQAVDTARADAATSSLGLAA